MPTPTPINSYSATADGSSARTAEEELLADDATCVMSNTTSDRGWAAKAACNTKLRGWEDDMTVATEPETDDSDSDAATCRHPIRMSHMVLPWGGPTASKATHK